MDCLVVGRPTRAGPHSCGHHSLLHTGKLLIVYQGLSMDTLSSDMTVVSFC